MIKELLKLANHLDSVGLIKEASYLDHILNKMGAGRAGDAIRPREPVWKEHNPPDWWQEPGEGLTGEGRGLSQYVDLGEYGQYGHKESDDPHEGMLDVIRPEGDLRKERWQGSTPGLGSAKTRDYDYNKMTLDESLGEDIPIPDTVLNKEDFDYWKVEINQDPEGAAVWFAQQYNVSDSDEDRDNLLKYFEKSLEILRKKPELYSKDEVPKRSSQKLSGIQRLAKLASRLDKEGLIKAADRVDEVIRKSF